MKALFHIDESDRWAMALGNVRNLLAFESGSPEPLTIEIVANGPAVRELLPDAARAAGILDALGEVAKKARVCACNNALMANGIAPTQLLPFVCVVPAGVVEIVMKQAEGFAYVKP